MQPRTVFTSRADGDLSVLHADEALEARRSRVVARPWSWLRQVHGSRVVMVDRPGAWAGAEADAAVTTVPGTAVAIHTADCVPLALVAAGVVGVAHVGWRGLMAGVVEATVLAVRQALGGEGDLQAEVGPCIRARCYEFGAGDLDAVTTRYGTDVRSVTAAGAPALDLTAGVTVALSRSGVARPADAGVCTACSPAHWSFRARGETGRQALVAWLEP